MPEFEELQLQVSLVDNASPQIDLIRRNIKELTAAKSDIESLRQKNAEFGEQLRQVAGAVARGPEAWLKFAASFGAVGVAVEAVGHSVFELSGELKKFGEEMLKIDVVAKRAGTDPGTVQNFIEIARTVGISAETVNRELIQMRQNIAGNIEGLTAAAQRVAFLPGGSEIFRRLQENLRTTHIAEEQAIMIKRSIDEYTEIVTKEAGTQEAAFAREKLSQIYGPREIIEKFPAQIEQMTVVRKQIAEREAAASKEVVRLQGEIINNFNAIFGMLKVNLMEDTLFGQGLLLIRDTLKGMREDMEAARREKRERQEKGEPEPSPWFGKRGPEQFLPWNWGDPKQKGKMPIWEWFKSKLGGGQQQQQQGGATEPQKLMGGDGVAGFSGPYAPMTPESWKGAADWAEQLHGDYSTNIERRDLMGDQNDETRKLIEQIRRTNALLSGEEEPTQKLGLLTTQMGGLPRGLGAGAGVGGIPPMGTGGLPPVAGGGGDGRGAPPGGAPSSGTSGTPNVGYPALGTPDLPRASYAGVQGLPGTPSGPAPGQPAQVPEALPRQGLPGGPSGPALTPEQRRAAGGGGAGGPEAPLPGGTGSSAIYNKLLAAYKNSSVVGTIPSDGARFGFKTGSAEEWARFGMIIAAAESDYNPKTAVSNRSEQSFGIFQYNHPQVPGGNAFDVDASVKQFVADSESSMKTHGGLIGSGRGASATGSILYRRFSTIQSTPPPSRTRQAEEAIAAAQRQPVAPPSTTAAPSVPQPGGRQLPTAPITGTVWGALGEPRGAYGGLKAHRHAGVDIGAPEGTPVYAHSDGVVVKSEFQKGATGGIVTVRYADGTEAKYMHLSDTGVVKPGQKVTAGQPIGLSGYSPAARSAGAHLHMELRDKNGALLDPLEYFGWGSSKSGATPEAARGTKTVANVPFGAQTPVPTRVAGPSQVTTTQPPITTPRVTELPSGTMTETATGTTWSAAREAQSERDRDNRRNIAISHMPGWQGGPTEPETEWQMRGGDFGARARRARGIFRPRGGEEEPDRSMLDRTSAGGLMRRRMLGTGKIDVTVKSHGQESVSQKGPFKPVKWHRHTQMQEADHGPAIANDAAGGDPGAGPG